MTKYVGLKVNGAVITLDYFVQAFVDHTVRGMLESLEGTGPLEELELNMTGGKLDITFNKKHIDTNDFVNKIFHSTLSGMVTPLKGVSGDVNTLQVRITQ